MGTKISPPCVKVKSSTTKHKHEESLCTKTLYNRQCQKWYLTLKELSKSIWKERNWMLKQQQKCDVVICISHLGWNSNRGEDDQYMISGSRNIDLVLGGHTHTYMETMEHWNNMDGKPVPVDQNGKSGIFIGKIVVDLK